MGRVLELYRFDDATIDKIHQAPSWAEDYITSNYSNVSGALHRPGDTVFYTDKAWDIARYLIQEYLASKGVYFHVLGEEVHDDLFSDEFLLIKAQKVKEINALLQQMQLNELEAFYDKQEIAEKCYRGDWVGDLDDYVLGHVATIKAAYQKAASGGDGLVVTTR
jgi:hypothetical protein